MQIRTKGVNRARLTFPVDIGVNNQYCILLGSRCVKVLNLVVIGNKLQVMEVVCSNWRCLDLSPTQDDWHVNTSEKREDSSEFPILQEDDAS